jgi:hypothetical protein
MKTFMYINIIIIKSVKFKAMSEKLNPKPQPKKIPQAPLQPKPMQTPKRPPIIMPSRRSDEQPFEKR